MNLEKIYKLIIIKTNSNVRVRLKQGIRANIG